MLHSTHRAVLKLTSFAMLNYPAAVLAEVSDKEPTADLFWIVGLATAFLCLISARIKPWLGIVCFIPAALWFTSLFLELHSPDVGPHLRSEQGLVYFLQAYAGFGLTLCGLLAGYIWHRRKTA